MSKSVKRMTLPSFLAPEDEAAAPTTGGAELLRNARHLLLLNASARLIGLAGMAYAARCLGPNFLGSSALVQTTAQQATLLFDGGFTVGAVRRIAGNTLEAPAITGTVVVFRLLMALLMSFVWAILTLSIAPADTRTVWLLGIPVLFAFAANITFVFQGIERLPVQQALNLTGAFLTAGAYFAWFRPQMFLGADLIVAAGVTTTTTALAWAFFRSYFKQYPIHSVSIRLLRSLLRESRSYWALAVVVYFYSVFQQPLIIYLLGAKAGGIYRSAFLLSSGVEVLFNSINSLLLARFVVWARTGGSTFWAQQRRLLRVHLVIAFLTVFVVFVAAEFLFSVLLGPEYAVGIRIFQILVVGRAVVFVGQIFFWGLAALTEDRAVVRTGTVGAIFSVGLNLIAIPSLGLVGAAISSVITEFCIHCHYYLLVRRRLVSRPSGS